MDALQLGLERQKVDLLIVDPLYLCLLAGVGFEKAKAENILEMGPLFQRIARTCLKVGSTPWLLHHSVKRTAAASRDPIGLEDLAYSGVAEFARQWWLFNRREPFEPDTGHSQLWFNAGGSAGHGGLWAVDVTEGRLSEDFSGRFWQVEVSTGSEARKTEQAEKKAVRSQTKQQDNDNDENKVMELLDKNDPDGIGCGRQKLMELFPESAPRFKKAVARLVAKRLIRELMITVAMPKGAEKEAMGIMRVKENP
jgi:hypothetical protein